MPARPFLSVLIPTRNAGAFLDEALQSVLVQDAEFEVIVVDDASTDDTPERLARCSDPRVHTLRLEHNLGVHGALNAGLALCRGELVARLDADDRMPAGRLAAQAAFLQAHPAVLAVGGQARTFGTREAQLDYPCLTDHARAWALFSSPLAHPATTFRRTRVARYPALPFAEDYLLWTALLERGEIANLDAVMVEWRMHGARVSVRHAQAQRAGTFVVWQRQLTRLGLRPTPAQLAAHALLQYARFRPVPVSPESYLQAFDWSVILKQANARQGTIPGAVLEVEVAHRLQGLVVQEATATTEFSPSL